MAQKTIDRTELERKYVVVGIPVEEVPGARRGQGVRSSQEWYQGDKKILFGLETRQYFPFYIEKQVAQRELEGSIHRIPVVFDVRPSPSSRPTFVVKPRTREDILEATTVQVPKQLYLRSQERMRRREDTVDAGEDEVLHRTWVEGNSIFRFYDAGIVLEAKFNKRYIWEQDFEKARFRCHGGYWSTGALLRGGDFDLIIRSAEQEARQEERMRRGLQGA